jgi:hypothetical protein
MPATPIPDYEPVLSPSYAFILPEVKHPGDPRKGAERIIDLLTGTGLAKGRELPFRIALSDEAYQTGLMTTQSRHKIETEWREWCTGTDF